MLCLPNVSLSVLGRFWSRVSPSSGGSQVRVPFVHPGESCRVPREPRELARGLVMRWVQRHPQP